MKHVTDPAELEIGRDYWLVAKAKSMNDWVPKISKLLADDGRKFFEYRMWAEPDNNQAMEYWDIFGPIPELTVPNFEALRQAGPEGINNEVTIDDLANYIRTVDGNHDMGAGLLAENICAWLSSKVIPIKQHEGMPVTQESKYGIRDNWLFNRSSGEFIPAEEPVFIFRARDKLALMAIFHYISLCVRFIGGDHSHVKALRARAAEFEKFTKQFPTRMKFPDTKLIP